MRLDRRISNTLLIASLSTFTALLAAQAKDAAWCGEAVTTQCSISGKLTAHRVCGPPWFCETKGDKPRFTIYVIQLHAPVHIACIRDHDSDPVRDCGTTTKIQIYALDALAKEGTLKAMVGSDVVATGTTHEPIAPMDQTPGIMDMESIRLKTNTFDHP